jgi:tRNA modification GTPase
VLERSREGSLLRAGIQVVLAGCPNVGKSSLLNRLAGEERAIVTPIAGTTRDALRETILIEGVPLILVDTAGLRESRDEVERLGVERAQREVARADLLLAVHDCSAPSREPALAAPAAAARIDVFNKIDLAPGFVPAEGRHPAVCVSAKTGAGIDALRHAILQAAGWRSHGESVFLARERHLRALQAAVRHLALAAQRAGQWELFAEELRLAHHALASIAGEFTADDLLGEIFARFCIGK